MAEHPPRPSRSGEDTPVSLAERIDRQSAELDAHTRRRVAERRERVRGGQNLSQNELASELELNRQFPITEIDGEVRGERVHFMGVVHDAETLLYHRQELENAVANAGTVVLEVAPEASGIRSPEFIEGVRRRLEGQGKSATEIEAWVQDHLYERPAMSFFYEMEQLAKKHEKPIAVADPHSGTDRLQDLVADEWIIRKEGRFHRAGDQAETLLGGAEVVSVIAAAGFPVGQTLQNEKTFRERKGKPAEESEEPKPSRRGFLIGGGAAVVAGALAPTNIANVSGDPRFSPAMYGSLDSRNVAVVEGIDRAVREGKVKGPIVFIYGARHAEPIMEYFRTPELQHLKYQLYEPVRRVQPPVIEGFEFVENTDTWKKTFSEAI